MEVEVEVRMSAIKRRVGNRDTTIDSNCRAALLPLILLLIALTSVSIGQIRKSRASFPVTVPKTWDDEAMAALEVPLASPDFSPVHVSADYYYRIPVRPIYKSYPVYAPGKEPSGYIEWLNQQEPRIAFDPAGLRTKEDWIKAGEIVFDASIFTGSLFEGIPHGLYVRDSKWHERIRAPIAKDGTLPFYRYVVREKGKVEVGLLSCGMCHTRVLPDGSLIKGGQGNFPFDRAVGYDYRAQPGKVEDARIQERVLFNTPWLRQEFDARLNSMSLEDIATAHEAIPPGVLSRHRSSTAYPVQVPDLIGVRERRYLDRTGLQQHRSMVDLMRYAALNQGADDLARFGDSSPIAVFFGGKTPDPSTQSRYSDEQLYALALYIYALKPPTNPNRFDALAALGKRIFEREGCAVCHTPPLYTNNKLTPVDGFKVPEDHLKKYDILPISVGTDPSLTLKTRRGTGYYKIPSLKGVWYRGPFEHSGSVATLEDWFDPKRVRNDYVPTGFRGDGIRTRAVTGHPFGLDLPAAERKALIAFLKTL